MCHPHEGYPNTHATVYCDPGPRWGRYVSIYINLKDAGMILCEVEVYEARCKYIHTITQDAYAR